MSDYSFNPLQMALKPLLEQAKEEDEIFALNVEDKEARGSKSFAECCDYIMGEAYEYASKNRQGNFGLAGCDDKQIISMIKHYYDEDNIEIKKVGSAKAKVAAVKKTENATAPAKPKVVEEPEPTLFDMI